MALDIKAIDVMNYPFTPEGQDKFWSGEELKQMANSMFKGKIPFVRCSPKEFVALMDQAGYDKVLIAGLTMFSWRNRKVIVEYDPKEVYDMIKDYPDRLIGLAGYNPFRIGHSLEQIEKAVKDYGFKGVYAHTLGFNVAPNDRRMYPLYAKCVELGIPFQIQVGHSLELMPSAPGRPLFLDEVALDFPKLTIIGSHTGWPWCEELIAVAWKHPNVYMDISAHMPRYLEKTIVDFMDSRGRGKTLFGTNGLGLKVCKDQFMEMQIKDETKKAVLRDNAMKVFKL